MQPLQGRTLAGELAAEAVVPVTEDEGRLLVNRGLLGQHSLTHGTMRQSASGSVSRGLS